jgi:hypothetical protein
MPESRYLSYADSWYDCYGDKLIHTTQHTHRTMKARPIRIVVCLLLLVGIGIALRRRMAPNALAGFKYLVENGHPYAGKASELPRVPATC